MPPKKVLRGREKEGQGWKLTQNMNRDREKQNIKDNDWKRKEIYVSKGEKGWKR